MLNFWTEKHPELLTAPMGNPIVGDQMIYPLNHAIMEGHQDVLEQLLDWKAPNEGGATVFADRLNSPDASEYVFLGTCPDPKVVRYAVSKGADVNRPHPGFPSAIGKTFLAVHQGLARMGSTDSKVMWLALIKGMTPLHEAAFRGNFGVVQELLALGADPRLRSDIGWTALDCAKMRSFDHITRVLESALAKWPAETPPAPWYACCAAADSADQFVVPAAAEPAAELRQDDLVKKASKESVASTAATEALA